MPEELNSDSEYARRTESVKVKEEKDTWHQGQRVTINVKKNVSGKHGANWRLHYTSLASCILCRHELQQ